MVEQDRTFTVSIANDKGVPLNVHIMAKSEYQAIDRAYTKFSSVQPDRKKYSCPKLRIRWNKRR